MLMSCFLVQGGEVRASIPGFRVEDVADAGARVRTNCGLAV